MTFKPCSHVPFPEAPGISCKMPAGHSEALHRGGGYTWCRGCRVFVSVGRRGAFLHAPGCTEAPPAESDSPIVRRMAAALLLLNRYEVTT